MTNDEPTTPEQRKRKPQMSVKDIKPRLIGAGVKGNKIVATKGKYFEAAIAHLSKKDRHFSGKIKLIKIFNDAMSQADKLNLPIRGFATSLRDMVEGKVFVEGLIGQFILVYGRFEGKFGTRGSATSQAMRQHATKNDYLPFYGTDGQKHDHPAPYAVRNWLAHIGTSKNQYCEDDMTKALDLLIKWIDDDPS